MAQSEDADLRRSILMGSEVEYDLPCHPCSSGGRNMEASGYCKDCCIYLCGQCINYHKTLPVTAHHQVVDKDKMPTKSDAPPAKVICTERCTIHKDKVIEYYCPVHKFLGCSACITLKHAACKDKEYIPEEAAGVEDRTDYKSFKKRLEHLIQKSKDTIKYGQESLKKAADNHKKVLQDIDAYQQEVNQIIDNFKREIKEQADQIKENDIGLMNTVTEEGNDVKTELEAMTKDIQSLLSKKQYSNMFIQMKTTEKKLKEFEDRLAELNKSSIPIYEFKKSMTLHNVLRRKDCFGMLLLEKSKETHAGHATQREIKVDQGILSETHATHVIDINAKSTRKNETYEISGACLLSTNHLVITDTGNASVKLLDTNSNRILSELKTGDYPCHIAKVDDGRMAVALGAGKNIMLLKYDKVNGLVIDREISGTASCYGITYIDQKLIGSFCNPGEVRIMSMNGDVLQKFAKDGKGKNIFLRPSRLVVSSQSQCIYVSDISQDSVTMLDMNGNVKAVYKDDELKSPRQMTVDHNGMVYLCGENSDNIHLLTADCRKVKVLLRRTDGLLHPRVISYCETTHRLYVGMKGTGVVKVYQIN